jgi:hypothetical protein
MHTWYKIRAEAIDNILESTVVWTLLREKGCFKTQRGGQYVTRTVRYKLPSSKWVKKGSTFSQGEIESRTMAKWTWRYLSGHVQRSIFDDQVNSGPDKIKDYVQTRLSEAREGLTQDLEPSLFRGYDDITTLISSGEIDEEYEDPSDGAEVIQGLNDMIPPPDYAGATVDGTSDDFVVSGKYGDINRATSYSSNDVGVFYADDSDTGPQHKWGPNYLEMSTPLEVNLVSDMDKLYETCGNNQSFPDIILMDLATFNVYKEYALDASQLVKDVSTRAADLGYDVLKFRGKPCTWSPYLKVTNSGTSYKQVLMVNSQYTDMVYDPNLWFDATEWKPIPLQGERIMHILSAIVGPITAQPRRHGRLYEKE